MFVMHVEYLLLRVMCVLMHVHVLVGVNVSVIMCILVWICVHVCSSAHSCGCVADGGDAMAAF